jgi:hypothetical protein
MVYDMYSKANEKLEYIVYGDTDSFFVDMTDLYCSKYNVKKEDLDQIIILDINRAEKNSLTETYFDNMKKLSDELRQKVTEQMYVLFSSTFNCKRENTIDFKFEWVATTLKMIAQKSYVYKQLHVDNIKKKNFGVKRSDPIYTKTHLDQIIDVLFKYGVTDKFILETCVIIKEYLTKLSRFDQTCGIPTTISVNISKYKTLTAQLKGLVNFSCIRLLMRKLHGIDIPISGTFEYKGFRYIVKPTNNLTKYGEFLKVVYDKFQEKNSLIKFSMNNFTEVFIPDNVYMRKDFDVVINILSSYLQPDYHKMATLSLYNYIERLSGLSFDYHLCTYLQQTENLDINILKKYVKT